MTKHFVQCAALALWLTACAAAHSERSVHQPGPSSTAVCSRESRLRHGGTLLANADGSEVWYRVAGPIDAPAVLVIHGGPGYNSLTFERSAGVLLERSLRVLYVDQRGCGRSRGESAAARDGLAPTVDDLERARIAANIDHVTLIAHSFGGVVAAAYLQRYPEHVRSFVGVDTTPYLGDALDHQVQFALEHADRFFPDRATSLRAAVARETTPFRRVVAAYGAVGRTELQRHLHFSSEAQQQRMEGIDAESGLLPCTRAEAIAALVDEGDLDRHATLGSEAPLGVPAILLAGRSSEVIGRDNVEAASRTWRAPVTWLDTGHFVYFEAPEEFAARVLSFVSSAH